MFTTHLNKFSLTPAWSKLAFTVTIAACLGSIPAAAQRSLTDPTVSVAGHVLDEQGRPVANVEVEAFAHKQRPTARSDETGSFVIDIPKSHRGSLALRAKTDDEALHGFYQYDTINEAPHSANLVLRPVRTVEINVVDGQQRTVEGASVAAMTYWFDKMDAAVSDRVGHALLRVPADAGLQYVWATKPEVGLDYFAYRRFDEPAGNVYKLPADHQKPLTLVLDGTRTVTVRVIDDQDKPMPGVTVYPWYFERPNKGDHLNISGVEDFQSTTDARGRAIFRWIPSDAIGPITFWTHPDGYYTPERPVVDPQGDSAEVIARLVALVPVRGTVTFVDGSPAPNAEVLVNGDGYQFDRFHQSTRTAADGSFEIHVYPDQYYVVSADLGRLVAPPLTRIVRQRQPPDDIHLVLQPATRVYGRLTAGDDHQPVVGQYLTLYQSYAEQYHALPPEERLPNPQGSNKAVGPLQGRNAQTDANGGFEFFVPRGIYYIAGPETVEVPKFEVTGEAPLEVNLHADRLDRVVLFGSVALESNLNRGVPEARVNGFPITGRGALVRAITDADGAFEVERTPCEMLFHAVSKDGSLIGVVSVGADDRTCEIPMTPAASARGRLVDANSGKPLADRQIDFHFQIPKARGLFIVALQNIATTDAEGKFGAANLMPGWEYTLEVVLERDRQGNPQRRQNAGAVIPKRGEVVDLGDVGFAPPDLSPMVTGKITVDGRPLAKGKVIFYPDKDDATEVEVKNGEFSTAKVPIGEMKLTFDFEGVPKKYQSVDTTPLRVSIMQGKNQLMFDLKTE